MHREILGLVEKPGRYIGQEWNQIVKRPAPGRSRLALAFPDLYEIGMSHLGLRILYDILNRREDIAAERVFCPALDMEAVLQRFGLPLVTLETQTPLAQLDVVGFSLQFELEYTNVLTMLDLGGIPLHGGERTPEHPLVVAGGPCALSPEPMADFIDVFVIGDGEEAFPALVRRWAELRQDGAGARRSRQEMLAELAQIEGAYVPSLYRTQRDPETGLVVVTGPRPGCETAPFPVRRAVVRDLGRFPFPTETLVPYGEIVHDRVAIEIARGCTEGCRFCQAGVIYRPARERGPADVLRAAAGGLRRTGYDEVSLTALSTADYSCFASLVPAMMDALAPERTALSVSSLRVYGLTRSIAAQLARVRRTGFTIAPEAGTQRLRDLVNKGITEADIDEAARIAFGQGWNNLKMYFMIGLPTETDEDVLGIAATALRVLHVARDLGRPAARLAVSVSSLIPKPHSTFQWEPMQPAPELARKQRLLREALRRHRAITFRYHGIEEGIVEGVMSRGDRRLGQVIEAAWRRGARFDSWTDHFDYPRWMDCLRQAELEPQLFLDRIPLHAPLPWDHIDSRVTKSFLVEDLHRGMRGRFSPACEKPFVSRDASQAPKPLENSPLVCYECGLECDLEAIRQERLTARDSLQSLDAEIETGRPSEPEPAPQHHAPHLPAGPGTQAARHRYRLQYGKLGELRWLSHLDVARSLQRGLKRAGIRLAYSQGFHPLPRLSFGPALPVGMEGEAELADFETAVELDVESAFERLQASLPAGLAARALRQLPPDGPPLSRCIDLAEYRAWIDVGRRGLQPEEFAGLDPARFQDADDQRQRAARVLAQPRIVVRRRAQGAVKEIDIRPWICALDYVPEAGHVRLWLRLGSQGQARPQEVLEVLYGVPGTCFRICRQALGTEKRTAAASPLEPILA